MSARIPGSFAPHRRRAAAIAVAALSLTFAACGSDDEPAQVAPNGNGGQMTNGQQAGGAGDVEAGGGNAGDGPDGKPQAGEEDASAGFAPREYNDSGGGSEPFRTRGGDNSVQEFGSEVEGEEFEQAAAALHGFLDARAQRAWAAACRYLSPEMVASLTQTAEAAKKVESPSCGAGLRVLTNPEAHPLLRQEARQVDVGSLRADSERGFLLYTAQEGTTWTIPVAKAAGEWKVAALAGLQLS